MDTLTIEQKVRTAIIEQFNLPEHEVTAATSLDDDLGADSLALTELVVRLEEAFGLELPDFRRMSRRRVGDVIDFLALHLAGPAEVQAA
jgi:acyl carrier protein